ncbi:LexA family protein [Salinicoccus sp. HZC-1]|uniref:LexA family protein n=1 Tax=Salinicoccus sp. HZC-1 TaxID=3385497 RepID=UPI00398A80E8
MENIFQERLKQAIKESGLSQAEVSKRSGISRGSITDYLKGRYEAKQDKVYDLAKVLGVRSEWLMGYNVAKKDITAPTTIQVSTIPVLSKVSAGMPIYSEQNIVDYIYLPADEVRPGKEVFGLIVSGDSMNKEFKENDIVIIEKDSIVENGEMGVVMVNGYNATLKQIKYVNDSIVLMPQSDNPEHDPQIYNNQDEVCIIGKVIGMHRKF